MTRFTTIVNTILLISIVGYVLLTERDNRFQEERIRTLENIIAEEKDSQVICRRYLKQASNN